MSQDVPRCPKDIAITTTPGVVSSTWLARWQLWCPGDMAARVWGCGPFMGGYQAKCGDFGIDQENMVILELSKKTW